MENSMSFNNADKKNFWNNHPFFTKGFCTFCVIAASITFYFIILRIDTVNSAFSKFFDIIDPVFYGIAIAFLLNPIMMRFEKRFTKLCLKKNKNKNKNKITDKQKSTIRSFSILIAVIIAILILYLIASFLFPEIVESLENITKTLPQQLESLSIWASNILTNSKFISLNVDDLITNITDYITNWVQTDLATKVNVWFEYIKNGVTGFVEIIFNIVIGFACSIYMMYNKEKFLAQCKKMLFAFFKPVHANSVITICKDSLNIFTHSIIGKIVDSAILGFICFAGIKILKMPYPILISVIIALTNIIPFFGPWLGAIPCGILILLTDPIQTIYFAIFILCLQQFDGNFLTPKIVGNYIGLPAFWVLVACLLGGGFYGVMGLILGVPIFAIIYQLFRNFISHKLKNKKLPSNTSEYFASAETLQQKIKQKK